MKKLSEKAILETLGDAILENKQNGTITAYQRIMEKEISYQLTRVSGNKKTGPIPVYF